MRDGEPQSPAKSRSHPVVVFAVGEFCTFGPPRSSVLWLPGRRGEVSTAKRRAKLDTAKLDTAKLDSVNIYYIDKNRR